MSLASERITRMPEICGGKACIAGHRVRVLDIVIWHEHLGMSIDEIADQIPTITLSDIHAALAYYFDHVDEIREDIRLNDEVAEAFRSKYHSKLKMKLDGAAD